VLNQDFRADDFEIIVVNDSGKLRMRLGINKRPLVYLPSDSKVVVDLSTAKGELSVEWFNLTNGEKTRGEAVAGRSAITFTAPFPGDAVLYIYGNTP